MINQGESAQESQLRAYLTELSPLLSEAQNDLILQFYRKLVTENEIQNLTRLISPRAFIEGHLQDVLALLKSGLMNFPALDLGSGGGVPGLLAACISPGSWVLTESEGRKAEFLSKTTEELGLSNVKVFSGRAELFLKSNSVSSIVARAVGPVGRIYSWLETCSTWNNLVLLKGPGWEKEWIEFSAGRNSRRLKIDGHFDYIVGPENKQRVIIRLLRVPRGTKK
ncbi:MAG: hypothetical protein A2Z97_05940 [Bdellovibrionales bacterium GWB1_52_6]|nr:MAG: hypothetical protein A2Z97_05940 [Bdellovibrionales bacterium GWB1_52_6]OFZ04415.1 MAG: hypothetical protein A2X97_07155 [Bdellovibrionales bacterium GWA1_52_35]HCM40728.1 hypothetical protein [Bdellovibrionales bacterium]